MLTDEERTTLATPSVPEDVRAELLDHLRRSYDSQLEEEMPEVPLGES